MGRLLVTYGAKISTKDLRSWSYIQDQKEFQKKCQFLKACGVNFAPHFIKDAKKQYLNTKRKVLGAELGCSNKNISQDEVKGFDVSFLPKEWRHVLKTAQSLGAKEVVIAGGALRDICLNKSMDSAVSVFIPDCGSARRNKNFVKKIFEKAKLSVAHRDGENILNGMANDVEKTLVQQESCDRWTVFAGENKTKYDIVFLKGHPQGLLMSDWRKFVSKGVFNICQIGTNGDDVVMTEDFKDGARRREIKVTGFFTGGIESSHFLNKYSDWKIKDNFKKTLLSSSDENNVSVEGKERPLGALPSSRPPAPPAPPRPPQGRHLPF